MRRLIPLLIFAAVFAAPVTAHAARATECTALNLCYCVEQDLKGAIDDNVAKIRQVITEQKAEGKAIGYMSVPLSTFAGGYFALNTDIAAQTRAAVEKRFGAKSLWILDPATPAFSLPRNATGAEYMLMWTRVLEGTGGLGEDFDLFYFVGPADFARALGLTGEGDMEKVDAIFEQRLASDAGFRRVVEQGRVTKTTFRNYYALRASVAFSYGAHDEWNILRILNERRRGAQHLGVPHQIASFFDGRATAPGASEQAVSTGYAGRCN